MIISGITPLASSGPHPKETSHNDGAHRLAAARGLVVRETVLREPPLRTTRPDAAFVTHLIATAEQAPQTRPLRRDTPATARATYGAAVTPSINYSGKTVSQTA